MITLQAGLVNPGRPGQARAGYITAMEHHGMIVPIDMWTLFSTASIAAHNTQRLGEDKMYTPSIQGRAVLHYVKDKILDK